MTEFGYTAMCEQTPVRQLVDDLVSAEQAGFDFSVMEPARRLDNLQPARASGTGPRGRFSSPPRMRPRRGARRHAGTCWPGWGRGAGRAPAVTIGKEG